MNNKYDSEIDQFHNHGLFVSTKTIVMCENIDHDFLSKHLKNIHILDSFDGTININMYSNGGDVTVGRAIYDAIKGCKNFVRITCYGEVSSCGTLILMAADERIMTPHSKLMIHAGNEQLVENHPRNIDIAYNNLRSDEEWMEDVYMEKINERRILNKKKKITRQEVKTMLTWDRYLSPDQAKSIGLIDLIK